MSNESYDLAVDYVLEYVPEDSEEVKFRVPKIGSTCNCIPTDVTAPDGGKWDLLEAKCNGAGVMDAIYEWSILNQ